VTIGPRARKALRILGYIVAALVTFVYSVHLAFPYDRLKDRAIEGLKSRYDVTVGSVERGWLPGDFSLVKVKLITRPTKPTEAPKIISIDRIDIDVGVMSMITGSVDVDIDAKLGAGHIAASINLAKGRLRATVSSKNLPLSDVPGLASVIGMPMAGGGNVNLSLDLPNNDWRKATARLKIDCPHCTVGGEGAFFKPRNANQRTASFVDKGVAVPTLTIDSLSAEWLIQGGKITTPKFILSSPHIGLQLDFEAKVGATLTSSTVTNGCMRYRGTDALKALDEKFYNALELTGGPVGPDDQRHLKLVGTLGTFKAVAKICGPDAGGTDDVTGGGRVRPDLSAVPVDGKGGDTTGAATTGTIEPTGKTPPDAQPAPPDALPTPKIDDVRIEPTDPAETGTEVVPGRNGKEPPEPPPPLPAGEGEPSVDQPPGGNGSDDGPPTE
jgi:type II secretion system protein N